MIYLWNSKQLARDFKNNAVSELHKFIYFVFYPFVLTTFHILTSSSLIITDKIEKIALHDDHALSLRFDFLEVILSTVLCYCLYQINKKGDGLQFVERYISLSFPVLLSILIFGIILLFPYGYPGNSIFEAFGASPTIASILSSIVVLILSSLYFYLRMKILFKIASGQME